MVEDRGGLQSGLKRRHVTMISLGGVIGAGLFVGSGAVINQTGPAAVLSYLAAGLLVVLVMRMLGEMAVGQAEHRARSPTTPGSRSATGRGFLVGWLYWYFWVIVLAVEAAAGAAIIQELAARRADLWTPALVLMVLLTAHQPGLGARLRRVRVLVRVDQGRGDRRLHRDSRSATCWGLTGARASSSLTADGGFAPEGVRRDPDRRA